MSVLCVRTHPHAYLPTFPSELVKPSPKAIKGSAIAHGGDDVFNRTAPVVTARRELDTHQAAPQLGKPHSTSDVSIIISYVCICSVSL